MKILGIETVTKIGSLAIVENGRILEQVTIDIQLNHAARFTEALDNLLHSVGIDIPQIDAIAVDVGPGSFTGIRVGIASARGLAQPLNKTLVGICSMEVLGHQTEEADKERTIVPIIDAKRGMIYSAWYKSIDGKIRSIKEPYLTTIEKLKREIHQNSFIYGPDMTRFRDDFQKGINADIDMYNTFPYAGMVAKIAEVKIKERSVKKDIEPMYIHDVKYKKIKSASQPKTRRRHKRRKKDT